MTTHNLPYNLPHDTAGDVPQLVARALQEDIGHGDITAMLIPADKEATASVISRDSAVICGRPWVDEVFRQLDPNTRIDWEISEGDVVSPNQSLDNSPPSFAPERRLSGSGRFDNASSRQTFEDAARRNLATRM